jgi:hypothetical protein
MSASTWIMFGLIAACVVAFAVKYRKDKKLKIAPRPRDVDGK